MKERPTAADAGELAASRLASKWNPRNNYDILQGMRSKSMMDQQLSVTTGRHLLRVQCVMQSASSIYRV